MLTISTTTKELHWQGGALTYPANLELVLLALAYRHREAPMSLDELERYALRCGLQKTSLRAEIYGFTAACQEVWGQAPVIAVASSTSGREKRYRLSPLIADVKCDLSPDEIGRLFTPDAVMASLPLMLTLTQAERRFEQGHYSEAWQLLRKADSRQAHAEQEVAVRCLMNWIVLRTESDGRKVRQHTKELRTWFDTFASQSGGVSDLVRARLLIQLARTPMAYQQRREARRLYLQAAKLLPEQAWREKAAVEAGLGYVEARAGGSLNAAEQHYRQALGYATLAGWTWSVQVQHGNLADLLCQKYQALPDQPRQHPLLEEAGQLLTSAQQLCHQFGFKGSCDTELYMARIAIWQHDLARAWDLIQLAFQDIDSSETHQESPFAWEIRGEWYLAAGETEKGLSNLRYAAQLEERLGTGVDAKRLRAHVQRLEQRHGRKDEN